jgi:hypothetical protein
MTRRSARRAVRWLTIAALGANAGVAAGASTGGRVVIAIYRNHAEATFVAGRLVGTDGALPAGVDVFAAVTKDRFGQLTTDAHGERPEEGGALQIVATIIAVAAGPMGYAAQIAGGDHPELLTSERVGMTPRDLHDYEAFFAPGRSAAVFVLDDDDAGAAVLSFVRDTGPWWLYVRELPDEAPRRAR